MSEGQISIRGLYKIFGKRPKSMLDKVAQGMGKDEMMDKHNHVLGLQDINLEIEPHKLQVIMGLSGSGKSTLIRHFNRLIEPTAGEVWVDGQNVIDLGKKELMEFRRQKMSMVFQKFALLPHRTIVQNARYGLEIQGMAKGEANEKARHWLERVGLGGQEDQYPGQLSGGMQQRVGLARALATDADILLMDEAFSALDPLIRSEMQDILLELQTELHKTIVFITHDLEEALKIGDNITILRDGAVIQSGSPQQIVMKPVDDYVADFTKEVNRGRVIKVGSLASPGSVEGPQLNHKLTLEEASQTLAELGSHHGQVMGDSGDVVGVVSLVDLVKAMARPEVESCL